MKRIFALLLVAVLLSACGAKVTSTISDAEMQTKVAQILTAMPTSTGNAPKALTATPILPTIQPTATQPAPTMAPTAAATQPPAATVTQTPAATQPPAATVTKPAATATGPAPSATKAPTQGPTATPVTGDPRPSLGQPTWSDKMANSDNWPMGADSAGFTSMDFKTGSLLLTALKKSDGWRISTADSLVNFFLEETVNTSSCTGKDRYGLIFRVPVKENPDQGYLAAFTCNGQFSFRKWDGPENAMLALTLWKTNSAIKTGPNQVNRLGVMVQGSTMTLYANGVKLTEVSDPSYKSGFFGIFAGAIDSSTYTVSITEIAYWEK
jgi:hypothetical protein